MSNRCALLLIPALLSSCLARAANDLNGDPLPSGAVARLGTVRLRHAEFVNAVAYSPDGKIIASSGWDRSVRLWAADTGKPLHVFSGHEKVVGFQGAIISSSNGSVRLLSGHEQDLRPLAFSADGKLLASGSPDGTIHLWDVATGQEERAIKTPQSPVTSLAFAPDGKTLASGRDALVHLWDVAKGDELFPLPRHRGKVTGLAFSPDGKLVASAGQDRMVRLWDAAAGKELRHFEGARGRSNESAASPLAFSEDGRVLVMALAGDNLVLVDPADGKELRRWPLPGSPVTALAFSKDGKSVATGGIDGVRIWDAAAGKARCACGEKWARVRGLAFSPDGATLASADGNAVRLWDAVSGKEIERATGHTAAVESLAVAPDDKRTATGADDGTVRLWDRTGKELQRLIGHGGAVHVVAFSPDGSLLASGGNDAFVILWNPVSGEEVRRLTGGQSGVLSLAWSPDGKTLAVGGRETTIQLWDANSGKMLGKVGSHSTGGITRLAWSADGKLLASKGNDHTVRVWEMPDGKERFQFEGGLLAGALAFSPDNKLLASSTPNPVAGIASPVQIFEPKLGRKLLELRGGVSVLSVAFSPDGKTLAGGSRDALVLWDASSGKEQKRFNGGLGDIWTAAYTHDGKVAATGSRDGSVLLWDVNASPMSEEAEQPGSPANPVKTAKTDDGGPLPAGAVLRLGSSRLRHGSVSALAYSPDGKTLASAGTDGGIRFWDAKSGKETGRLAGTGKRFAELRFASDGRSLLSVGFISAAWRELPSGLETRRYGDDRVNTHPVTVSADGKLVAMRSNVRVNDNAIRLLDGAGKELFQLEGHQALVESLAFSPDGKILASGGDDQVIRVWDTATGKPIGKWAGHNSAVQHLLFSPDGKVLVSSAGNNTRLWATETGKNFAKLEEPLFMMDGTAAFTPDGKTLAMNNGGEVFLFDAANGKVLKKWRGQRGGMGSAIAVAPDGKTLATASSEGPIRLWDASTGQEKLHQDGHQEALVAVALAPDGQQAYTISLDGSCRGWDAAGKERWRIEGLSVRYAAAAFSPDGRWLAARKTNGAVGLFALDTGMEKRSLASPSRTAPAGYLAFNSDGTLLAADYGSGDIRLWETETGKEKAAVKEVARGTGRLTLSPDGELLAAPVTNGALWVRNVATSKDRYLQGAGGQFAAFTPDGRTLAAGVAEGVAQWEAATGQARGSMTEAGGSPVQCLTFAQDGRVLITGGAQKVRYWDRVSGKVFYESETGDSSTCLAVSADGRKLITGGGDGTAIVWDLADALSRRRPLRSVELTAEELDALWTALGGSDGNKSWRAAGALIAAPKQAVPLLKKRLPAETADEKQLARLLTEMDSDVFAVRERATDELAELGRKAEAEVRKALKKTESAETLLRLKEVLARIEKKPKGNKEPASEQVLASRAVEVLELMNTPDGIDLLREWAKGEPDFVLAKEAKAALKRLGGLGDKRP